MGTIGFGTFSARESRGWGNNHAVLTAKASGVFQDVRALEFEASDVNGDSGSDVLQWSVARVHC